MLFKAKKLLKNRNSKKVHNKTYLVRDNGEIYLKLYSTNVITFKSDNKVVLNSGGWRTPTTKRRINDFIFPKYHIFQENYKWYVSNGKDIIPFEDGVEVTV